MRYPKYLYQTPDGWSQHEQFWLSWKELLKAVRDLRRVGIDASVDAARAWRHVGGGVYADCGDPARREDGWFYGRPSERRVRLRYDRSRRAWLPDEVLGEYRRGETVR